MLSLIGVANAYHCRPSSLLNLHNDEYSAYCFDEACAYIIKMIEKGNEPNFNVFDENKKHFSSFSDMYKNIT